MYVSFRARRSKTREEDGLVKKEAAACSGAEFLVALDKAGLRATGDERMRPPKHTIPEDWQVWTAKDRRRADQNGLTLR